MDKVVNLNDYKAALESEFSFKLRQLLGAIDDGDLLKKERLKRELEKLDSKIK